MTFVAEPMPGQSRRSALQVLLAIVVPLIVLGFLLTRIWTGGVLWAALLGILGCAAWLLRASLVPRLVSGRRGWELVLLLCMLVPGAVAAVPGDGAPFAPVIASIVVVVGGRRFPLAVRCVWCAAALLLAIVGMLLVPGTGAALSVAVMFVLALLIALARWQTAAHREAELAAQHARHGEELAAARAGILAPDAVRERFPQLSAREAEVLGLMARGRSNAEIAADLHLSVATVKSHVNALFAKLPARDRAHAIAIAYGTALPG